MPETTAGRLQIAAARRLSVTGMVEFHGYGAIVADDTA
jgi:hypothetical protein